MPGPYVTSASMPATTSGRPLTSALRRVTSRPRLIVLFALDGMRQDYFDRDASVLPTLTRLRRQGAWFSGARITTCPRSPAPATRP